MCATCQPHGKAFQITYVLWVGALLKLTQQKKTQNQNDKKKLIWARSRLFQYLCIHFNLLKIYCETSQTNQSFLLYLLVNHWQEIYVCMPLRGRSVKLDETLSCCQKKKKRNNKWKHTKKSSKTKIFLSFSGYVAKRWIYLSTFFQSYFIENGSQIQRNHKQNRITQFFCSCFFYWIFGWLISNIVLLMWIHKTDSYPKLLNRCFFSSSSRC